MPESNVLCGPANLSRPHLIARDFNAVEISSSFETHLKPELTRLWVQKCETNPRFRFTVKLHRRFTHDRALEGDEIKAFKDGVWPLARAGRLGCVLMQFPWSFRYTAENRAHFIRLRREFHEFPLVAEMRHSSWMLDEAIGTFIDYRVGFCNIDQPVYTKAMPPTSFLTSSTGYVRLHGRNCFNWFGGAEHPSRKPRYDYAYSESELAEWVRRIDSIRGYASNIFVIANNGANGKAIATAARLDGMLSGKLIPARRGMAAQTALFTEFHSRAVA
jgi:uncharacterized protein YecE (DUF72 family)